MKRWRFYALGFLLLATLDTAAHVFFKLAAGTAGAVVFDLAWLGRVAALPTVYAAIACYVATFFIWMTLLRHAPIGPAFAASHLELVGVLLASATMFGERISLMQWAGAATILAGIACLAASEKPG